MAATTVDEVTFCKAYLKLLYAQTPVLIRDKSFVGEGGELILLPEFPTPKKKRSVPSKDSQDRQINITIKSIKAPKFTESLVLSGSSSVIDVKQQLSQHAPAAAIKLLVKGKVIPDSRLLRDLTDSSELAFMAMVSATTAAPEPSTPETMTPTDTSAIPWPQIEQVLNTHMGASEAQTVLAKFKSVCN